MIRFLAPCFAALLLVGGCAQTVWEKPGATTQDFTSDKYACERDARQSAGFDTGFVGAIEIQSYFERCLQAHGWMKRGKAEQAMLQSRAALLRGPIEKKIACIEGIRSKPKYEVLQPYLVDIRGNYTMAQKSDGNIPTPSEAHILLDYHEDAESCLVAFQASIAAISRPAAAIVQDENDKIDNVTAELIRRQISWGEAASHIEEMRKIAAAKIMTALASAQ